MKTRLLPFAALAALIVSCDSDSSDSAADNDIITHFVESRYHVDGGNTVIQSEIDYYVTNGKYDFYTAQSFENGVSTGVGTFTDFNYENGLLVSKTGDGSTRHFYYNAAGKLIGADRVMTDPVSGNVTGTLYYRFVHQPGNIVFCERINAPYDDLNAVISHRFIMDFDENDNIVMAGPDTNQDGVMEQPNIFTTVNGDITAIQFGDGAQVTYAYSDIVNNQHFLAENSYGKQVMRLMCSETYGGSSEDQLSDVLYSRHLLESDIALAEYVVNESNNFIKKATLVQAAEPGEIQWVTEYFFD